MARELTDKQRQVLHSIESYWSLHQVPPSISDLAKDLGVNKATAYEHLLALKKKGYLRHQPKAGRTWRLTNSQSKNSCTHIDIPVLEQPNMCREPFDLENIKENIVGTYNNNNKLFAIKVSNNSTKHESIKENDILIIDANSLKNGFDLVIALEGEKQIICRFDECEKRVNSLIILGKILELRRYFY